MIKCRLCPNKIKNDAGVTVVAVETGDGPIYIKVCPPCAQVFAEIQRVLTNESVRLPKDDQHKE